jgi:hypothetical protein
MKLSCMLGLHNWERSSITYHGNVIVGIYGQVKRVPGQTYTEKCTKCGAERGVVATLSERQYFSADFIKSQIADYEETQDSSKPMKLGKKNLSEVMSKIKS